MSTIVYQELQPYNNESTTLISLKLKDTISQTYPLSSNFEYCSKITPSSNCISQPSPATTQYGPIEMRSSSCSWSEIEALTTKRKNPIEEQVYVHPLVKKSSFKLSEKSLEMCTESLGSETGFCVMENSDFFQLMSKKETRKPLEKLAKREELVLNKENFPPPLTTLRGSNPLYVRPVREDGRLVIEAVRSTPIHSYMKAERSDGRLKLSFVRDCRNSEHEDDNCDLQISGYEGSEEGEDSLERNNVEEDEEYENNEGECVIISDDLNMLDELKGVTMEFEVRLGLEKVQRRPRGCKEGGQRSRRLINWEPFWVAT